MNLDLITKLAKLANNNPNEHEANLAARKVCKLLAEGNFQFVAGRSAVDDAKQARTWNDVRRSTEPEFKSRYTGPGAAFDFEEIFRRMNVQWEPFRRQQQEQYYKSPLSYWDDYKKPSEQKEERLLKCRSCGNSKLTKFVGLPELYECNTCQWTAYEKSTSKK